MLFDTLENLELYLPVLPELQAVIEVMDKGDVYTMKDGVYPTSNPEVSYRIDSYQSGAEGTPYLIHRKTTVLMILLEGEELESLTWREAAKDATPYDSATDQCTCDGDPLVVIHAAVGRFCVFYPGEPHRSGLPVVNPASCKRVTFLIRR